MIYKKPNGLLHWFIIMIAGSLTIIPTLDIKESHEGILSIIIGLGSFFPMFIGWLYIIERIFKIKLL